MATQNSLRDLLEDFTTSTQSALDNLLDTTAILPPEDGITLLTTKNEIFLAYLQALTLRNLSVIRSIKYGSDVEITQKLSNDFTKKLVEHRVYLERGVRPLEQRIKYQVDRVIKAADDEERIEARQIVTNNGTLKRSNVVDLGDKADKEDSDEDDSDESFEEEDQIDAASFKPNVLTMQNKATDLRDTRRASGNEDGAYRPPRISATSMPTTQGRERTERKPHRSVTLDEYVNTELSAAPQAEPSIGSNITAGGRKNPKARQVAEEKERQEYEETHLVRLPPESKKERAKKRAKYGDSARSFGGEEWRDIGQSADRIGDLTRKRGKDSALDKSRKRRAVEDGPRDSGMGNTFEAKKNRMLKRSRR